MPVCVWNTPNACEMPVCVWNTLNACEMPVCVWNTPNATSQANKSCLLVCIVRREITKLPSDYSLVRFSLSKCTFALFSRPAFSPVLALIAWTDVRLTRSSLKFSFIYAIWDYSGNNCRHFKSEDVNYSLVCFSTASRCDVYPVAAPAVKHASGMRGMLNCNPWTSLSCWTLSVLSQFYK
jgi:hypothetical protein